MRKLKEEVRLIKIAQTNPCDKCANEAMKKLREDFDKTYGWCMDCDGFVCKEKDCCLNK